MATMDMFIPGHMVHGVIAALAALVARVYT